MKPIREWESDLAGAQPGAEVTRVPGREGDPTLKVGEVFLHSRYKPREEAERLIESAGLDAKRPVLVVGLGLGYHILELLKRGVEVAVVEPDHSVAKCAIDGPLHDTDVLLGIGDADSVAAADAFKEFAGRLPQVFVHPPTAHLHPQYAEAIEIRLAKSALDGQRLNIAVVGPMYGGSLPIAGYLERAFRSLGHRTLLVGNDLAWETYDAIAKTVRTKKSAGQLQTILSNFLNEWCYARVAEFAADICIVLAQAPVGPQFPARLAQQGIVTAFWFVENWRHLTYWRSIAPYYDFFFHIQPGEFERRLDETGVRNHAFVQTACDPEVHRPVELTAAERAELECDISFAGAGYYNRQQLFKGLTDYRFKIWGVDWFAQELKSLVCRPEERFTPEFFAKIVAASTININLHSSQSHTGVDPQCDAINPRVFEIAACGGFQLCDPCIGLDSHFDLENEIPAYRTLTELRARIDYFLARPEERRVVADRARARALRDHTYTARAQRMLDLILERHGARVVRKGIRIQRTVSEVAERVGRDSDLGRYLSSLPADLLFTHENINAQLTSARTQLIYPEKVFAYLREVRNHAEALFAAKE
ncbi:MAG: glycosyltransferase [Candidatus Hydrogenedentes bacterium]|nr:glycosyltransferase [Candidatus Hydrogenedentota bacterium]